MKATKTEPAGYPDCWLFEPNRRVYRRNDKGETFGGPIWREHWVKIEIVGETTRSWVTSCGGKVPKKEGHAHVFSEEEINRRALVADRYSIAECVRHCCDYDKLKQIADIVNYEEYVSPPCSQ
jgi:hypothetical protein